MQYNLNYPDLLYNNALSLLYIVRILYPNPLLTLLIGCFTQLCDHNQFYGYGIEFLFIFILEVGFRCVRERSHKYINNYDWYWTILHCMTSR